MIQQRSQCKEIGPLRKFILSSIWMTGFRILLRHCRHSESAFGSVELALDVPDLCNHPRSDEDVINVKDALDETETLSARLLNHLCPLTTVQHEYQRKQTFCSACQETQCGVRVSQRQHIALEPNHHRVNHKQNTPLRTPLPTAQVPA